MTDLHNITSFVAEFDFQRCLNMLKEGYENDAFEKAFRDHLKVYVPAIFKSFSNWNGMSPHETKLADKLIFNVFKGFIVSSSTPDFFEHLKKVEKPSLLCAKVFKLGEPTYSCRDCGVDPTCVLCIDCFQNSSHKHHKYRMSTSGGGGYCDCGDKEAWKSEPFCDTHRVTESPSRDMENDPLNHETRRKLTALLSCMNEYILDMFTLDDLTATPPDLHTPSHALRGPDKNILMLYNDEIHTYDQVTKALKEAINCTEHKAVEYATIVDREGRAIIKIGEQADCQSVKTLIEATTSRSGNFHHHHPERKPLKVAFMCPVVFAHQTFAGCAAQWLKSLIDDYGIIRALYAELSLSVAGKETLMAGKEETSVVERTILNETKMWKSARNQLRQLFMTGIFMNPNLKKKFSIIFTKVYNLLIQRHVIDDHEIMYSALSEGVQIFTVPSLSFPKLMASFLGQNLIIWKFSFLSLGLQLFTTNSTAKFLITEHNLLKVLINTFYEECEQMVKDGVFKPDLQDPYSRFKRSLCILHDIKYALLLPPEVGEWNDKLKTNFLDAFQSFLFILETMEGMDSITRQVESHVEYELEWEHAFNFQFRFMELYSLIAAWCESDEKVLERSIKMCIKTFLRKQPYQDVFKYDYIQVGEHRLEPIKKVDFTTTKVSIHQPLARMLVNLFVCYNCMQELKSQRQQQRPLSNEEAKRNFVRIGLKQDDIIDLWRPSLLVAVFEAQVNAKMWRRNGLVVQNQVYYYRNVRCRSSMFDMDCLYMQFAASLLPGKEFLLMLIYSFGLSNWARFEYDSEITPEESMKQIISLAESMLHWLLVVFCERYVAGVGQVAYRDVVKYEVVHNLCIQPMAFSELTNSISDVIKQHDKERDLEELIKEVAVFKKPSNALGKGLYELKREYYKLYNPFYYHYSKVEKSKSEENVRSHLKKQGESTCIHPPAHDLPLFSGIFSTITDIFQSDVFLHMVRLVLRRSTLKASKSWSEAQLEMVLFLVTYALKEEERRLKLGEQYYFVKKCIQVPPPSVYPCPSVLQLLQTLQQVTTLQHVHIKELIVKVHTKLKEMANAATENVSEGSNKMPAHLFASSGGISENQAANTAKNADELTEAQKWSEKGRLKRERVMANMAKQQTRFIKENQEFFESTSTENKEKATSEGLLDEAMEDVVMTKMVALGLRRSVGVANLSKQTCILCQEDQEISWSENALVFCSFMQKSSVLSSDRSKPLLANLFGNQEPLFAEVTLPIGVYTSTCGHVMHASCWKIFFESLRQRDVNRNRLRMHQTSYEATKKEFLCPMCEAICNCVLPLIPSLVTLNKEKSAAFNEDKNVDLSLEEWLDGIFKTVENSVRQERDDETDGNDSFFFVPCPLSTVTKMMAEGVATRFQAIFDYMIEDNSSAFSESIVDMLKRFAQDIFERTMDIDSDLNDDRVITTLWNTCSYSIMSIENVLRAENKALFGSLPSRQAECIGSLIRLAAISSGVFPDDVVKERCIRMLCELTSCGRMRSIYRLDMFHCLVSLCLSLPTLYIHSPPNENSDATDAKSTASAATTTATLSGTGPVGGGQRDNIKILATPSGRMNESNALKFVLGHHLAQIMVSIQDHHHHHHDDDDDVRQGEPMEGVHTSESATAEVVAMELDEAGEADQLLNVCKRFRREARLPAVKMTAPQLLDHIKESALPFLRCSALFFHYLTSVPAPLKLFDKNNAEFDIICEYLDLPCRLSSIFAQSPSLTEAIISICQNSDFTDAEISPPMQHPQGSPNPQASTSSHSKSFAPLIPSTSHCPPQLTVSCTTREAAATTTKVVMQFPRKPNKLLELPTNYSQLINKFSMFTCPKFNSLDESRCPAMCLVCGTIVCSQSYCCQVKIGSKVVGAAMAHSFSCGAGTGIFFRVRDCQVIMFYGMSRGCFVPPPYLDEHGETDEGLRRGNPLFLCNERYEQLQKLWLNHMIPEEIVHKLELMPNFSTAYDWHHF